MKTYIVFTQCGTVTQYNALSSYEAANLARNDGWSVIQVLIKL